MISDRLVHASIVDGIRLCKAMHDTYKHCDMLHLEQKLQEHQDKRIRVIITDGVFSMDGDIAPLDKIVALGEEYNALVFLDDSHASGFIGKTGRGVHEHFGVMGKIDILTTTLGKALGGASGGCVSGRKEIVELCRQRARPYLFSNAVPPPIVASAIKVLEVLSASTERRDKLEANAKFWRQGLKDAGFVIKDGDSPIVPVMLFNAKLAQDVARDLYGEGIYVLGSSSRWSRRARRESAPNCRRTTTSRCWQVPWSRSRRSARSTGFWASTRRASSRSLDSRRLRCLRQLRRPKGERRQAEGVGSN